MATLIEGFLPLQGEREDVDKEERTFEKVTISRSRAKGKTKITEFTAISDNAVIYPTVFRKVIFGDFLLFFI